MKRKKWSEVEEQSLLTKYSDLLNSGALFKLKTREKKFKPIADHVNSAHHLRDPLLFPFKWSWRDVSIKVQNMRHQYLGVKQKIRTTNNEFNWSDGENHWENFLKYKEVFGDVELDPKDCNLDCGRNFGDELFTDGRMLGLPFGIDSEGSKEGEDEEEDDYGDSGCTREKKPMTRISQKRLRMAGNQILGLRNVIFMREEKRRDRDWGREEEMTERENRRREAEFQKEIHDDEKENEREMRELELEEKQMAWARKEMEKRLRLEMELSEERERRMKIEEKREEEEMEWRERLVGMQIEHEKQMMQMHGDAFQNQMQILGVMTRLICQFFGVANDDHHVLQNLQDSGGGLVEEEGNVKADAASPSEFCRL
ncbi:unnamed protein product [Cuscuta epithymum]|uniref:Stress response protein NST1-like n=1 Tax=Cuscuta epithymum TaxID=186058 RepID=A0AAV0E7X6_9ASTE|nr:unnamed protein product [Cuscuta epithymum]CAH9119124.1 unnamed protein product [Cuscuta epithymum]